MMQRLYQAEFDITDSRASSNAELSGTGRLDIAEARSDNCHCGLCSNDDFQNERMPQMGDKGGKKDKDKSKKQKAAKQDQSAKGKKPSK